MNYKLLALIPLIPSTPLCAEDGSTTILTMISLLGGAATAGAMCTYYLYKQPPHTLESLEKKIDALYNNVEKISSTDSLTIALEEGERAIESIEKFNTEAEKLIADSLDTRLTSNLKAEERERLEKMRISIFEKRRHINAKRAELAAIAPHAKLAHVLNEAPAIPTEQIGSRIEFIEKINGDIDTISLCLQQSRAAVGGENMRAAHTAAEERIQYLMKQRKGLEQSPEYARELTELKIKTAYEQAQAQRIQEERTTKKMLERFDESERQLKKAEQLKAEATRKEAAVALITLESQNKVNKAKEDAQNARIELAHEQFKTSKLELTVQETQKAAHERLEKLTQAENTIRKLTDQAENAGYYRYYIEQLTKKRAGAAKKINELEQELENPSMNPENHVSWRAKLKKMAAAIREETVSTCPICTEEIENDFCITHCDQKGKKVAHEYHGGCLKAQRDNAPKAGSTIACALCRAPITTTSSL